MYFNCTYRYATIEQKPVSVQLQSRKAKKKNKSVTLFGIVVPCYCVWK